MIRGITIGLSTNVRLLADDFGRRGSLSRLAMRGTPFGPPSCQGAVGVWTGPSWKNKFGTEIETSYPLFLLSSTLDLTHICGRKCG
jgi:hypothetical protein